MSCHILLGKPWLYENWTVHRSKDNPYEFFWMRKKNFDQNRELERFAMILKSTTLIFYRGRRELQNLASMGFFNQSSL